MIESTFKDAISQSQGQEYWKYVSFKELNKVFQVSDQIQVSIEPQKGLHVSRESLELRDTDNQFAKLTQKHPGHVTTVTVEKTLDKPIFVTLEMSGDEQLFLPQLNFLVKSGQSAEVYIDTLVNSEQGFANILRKFQVEQGAFLKVYSREQGATSNFVMQSDFMSVEKDAHVLSVDMTLPAQWRRHNVEADLKETGAEAQLLGFYLNNDKNFVDHHTSISHLKPHTTSLQTYKGILSDSARAVFNGKVFIDKGAYKSSSEQINKNLLLSKKAEVDTKPELQIYNDDVKATHGATVGQLDKEQLFYLESRGLSRDVAWRVLSEAFVFDLFEDFNEESKRFFIDPLKSALAQFKEVGHEF